MSAVRDVFLFLKKATVQDKLLKSIRKRVICWDNEVASSWLDMENTVSLNLFPEYSRKKLNFSELAVTRNFPHVIMT